MKTQKNQGRSTRKVTRLPETPHIINVNNRGVSLGNGSYAKTSYYSEYGY